MNAIVPVGSNLPVQRQTEFNAAQSFSSDFEEPVARLSARSPAQTQGGEVTGDLTQRQVKAQLKRASAAKALHVFAKASAITVGVVSFPLMFARSVLGIVPRIGILAAKSLGVSCDKVVNHKVSKILLGEYAVDKLQRADTKQVAIQALKAEMAGALVLGGLAAGMVAAAVGIPSAIAAAFILGQGPIFAAIASPYSGAVSDAMSIGSKVQSLITNSPNLFSPLMSFNVFDVLLNSAYTDGGERYRLTDVDDKNQNELAALEKPQAQSRFKASTLFHLYRAGNLDSFAKKLFHPTQMKASWTLENRFDSRIRFSEAQSIAHTRSEIEMLKSAKSMVPADHPIQNEIQAVESKLQALDTETEAISNMSRQQAVDHVFAKIKGQDHYAMNFAVHGLKSGHATMLVFDKIQGTSDQYNITLINRGDGIQNHLTVSDGGILGKKKIAAARVFPNVQIIDHPTANSKAFTKEYLTKLMVDDWSSDGKVSTKLDAVYKELDSKANYNPTNAADGPKDWKEYNHQLLADYPDFAAKVIQAPQKDGNCTYSCIRGYMRMVSDSKESFLRVDNLLADLRLQAAQEFVHEVSTRNDASGPVAERVLYLMNEKVIPSLEKKFQQSNQRVAGLNMPSRVSAEASPTDRLEIPRVETQPSGVESPPVSQIEYRQFMEPISISGLEFDDESVSGDSVSALPDLNENDVLIERENQFLSMDISPQFLAGAIREAGHTNFRATGTGNSSWLRAAWVGVLSSFESTASFQDALENQLNPKLSPENRLGTYEILTLTQLHSDLKNPSLAQGTLDRIGNLRGPDHAIRNLNALGDPKLEEKLAVATLEIAARSDTISERDYDSQTLRVADGKEASFELIEPLFDTFKVGLMGVQKSTDEGPWQLKGSHNSPASEAVLRLQTEVTEEINPQGKALANQVVLLRRNDQHFQVFIPSK